MNRSTHFPNNLLPPNWLSVALLLLSFHQTSAQLLPPPDAQLTRSGYPYVLYTQSNTPRPTAGNIVYFHAEIGHESRFLVNSRNEAGRLSVEMPKKWPKNGSPAPIEETAMHMGIGDSATVWVPIEKFSQRPPGFDKAKYYIVRLVLTEITTPTTQQRNQQLAHFETIQTRTRNLALEYTRGNLDHQLEETASGLKYIRLKTGDGPNAKARQTVWVHYLGMFLDGKTFDDSFRQGEPLTFILGRNLVIKGWDEGIALLNPGSQAVFFIPPHLAYGREGAGNRIPPNTELVFYVQLDKIK